MPSPPPDEQNGRAVTPANDIHLTIPQRFYLVPGAAIIVGTAIGLVRGSQTTSLRFLAENVHRPPTTVQGWYFYNKTKNYKVLLGGVKGAGVEASKLAVIASGWVGIEEGLERAGWGQVSELGAAVGTAGVCSAVYRLPWKATSRTLAVGLMIGSSLKLLKWGRERLQIRAGVLAEGPDGYASDVPNEGNRSEAESDNKKRTFSGAP